MIRASGMGHAACLSYAIDAGGDVNYGPYVIAGLYGGEVSERTPLIAALEYNKDSCVDILLKAGADVNKTNLDSDTPLAIAVAKGN